MNVWVKTYPLFSDAYKTAKGLQKEFLAQNALGGISAQPFSIFTAKNICGWRDKKEVDVTAKIVRMDKIKRDGKEIEFDIGDSEIIGSASEVIENS